MPAIRFLGRRWHLSEDETPVPAFFGVSFHLAYCIQLARSIAYVGSDKHDCQSHLAFASTLLVGLSLIGLRVITTAPAALHQCAASQPPMSLGVGPGCCPSASHQLHILCWVERYVIWLSPKPGCIQRPSNRCTALQAPFWTMRNAPACPSYAPRSCSWRQLYLGLQCGVLCCEPIPSRPVLPWYVAYCKAHAHCCLDLQRGYYS
jgi:hypothetical protein